jgi:VanZ family protein
MRPPHPENISLKTSWVYLIRPPSNRSAPAQRSNPSQIESLLLIAIADDAMVLLKSADSSYFSTSTENARMEISKIARIAAWCIAAAIAVLSVVPPALRPETGTPNNIEHFLIYFAAGFAFGLGYKLARTLLAILSVMFCGCIEVLQLFVPGRHARLSDFIVDSLAMCLGLMTTSLMRVIRQCI